MTQQFDVGAFNQLIWLDIELGHPLMCFEHRLVGRFTIRQHHFKLQKMPQTFHFIEVHTGSADFKKRSVFAHPARLTIGQR